MLSSHNFENSIIYCSLHSLEGIISSETVSIRILVSDLGVGNSQQAALLFCCLFHKSSVSDPDRSSSGVPRLSVYRKHLRHLLVSGRTYVFWNVDVP